MKISEILTLITEIESKFPVEKWKLDGIYIWPIIRMDIMMGLYYCEYNEHKTNLDLTAKAKEGLKVMRGIPRYLVAYLRDYSKNKRANRHFSIVMLGDGISKARTRNVWMDKYCDPFITFFEERGVSSLLLEPLHQYIIPRLNPSNFVQIYLDLYLINNLLVKRRVIKKKELDQFDRFVDYIKSKKLDIPITDISRVEQIFLATISYTDYFRKVLLKVKPKLAFVVSYYGPRGMAFNLACKQLNIKSVDIQHGIEGEYHAAYGRWTKVPKGGYEFLPTIFWCWSEHEANSIKKWNKKVAKKHYPVIGGNLFLKLWQDDKNELVLYYDWLIREKLADVNILITLSPVEEQNKILIKLLLRIIQLADINIKWWMRLHPCSLSEKGKFVKMLCKNRLVNVELDLASDLPLYTLLRNMDLHITFASATVIEAWSFNVPSIIVSREESRYFTKQIELGGAIVADTPNKLKESIDYFLKKREQRKKNNTHMVGNKALNGLLSIIKK